MRIERHLHVDRHAAVRLFFHPQRAAYFFHAVAQAFDLVVARRLGGAIPLPHTVVHHLDMGGGAADLHGDGDGFGVRVRHHIVDGDFQGAQHQRFDLRR